MHADSRRSKRSGWVTAYAQPTSQTRVSKQGESETHTIQRNSVPKLLLRRDEVLVGLSVFTITSVLTTLFASADTSSRNTTVSLAGERAGSNPPLAPTRSTLDILREFGFIGDGKSHPLSTRFATIMQAQQHFPHALSMNDELDWCALQGALDDFTPNSPAFLDIPPCRAVINRPLNTGGKAVTLRGSGQSNTFIQLSVSDQVCIVHGSTHDLATGILEISQLTLRHVNAGVGGTAICAVFSNSFPFHTMSLSNVFLRDWAVAVDITDAPRGVSFENVIAAGPDNKLQLGGAFRFTNNRGCFSYDFYSVMTSGYEYGFDYVIHDSLEGQVFTNCRSYNGGGLLRAMSYRTDYQSLLWEFKSCDWQGYANAISLTQCRDVRIRGGYFIIDPKSAAPIRSAGPEVCVFDFHKCTGVEVLGASFDAKPKMIDPFGFIRFDGACRQCLTDLIEFSSYSPALYGIEFKLNALNNVMRECRTVLLNWWGTNPVVSDAGGNQISEWLIGGNHYGHVSFGGCWTIEQTTDIVESDRSGHLEVIFPSRPDSGKPFFLNSPPTVVFSVIGSLPSGVYPTLIGVDKKCFVVRFGAELSSINIRIAYIAEGT